MSAPPFQGRDVEIEADFARMPAVRAFAEHAAAAAGFGDTDRYAIRSAFGEAVANAIEHGSQPGDTVRLEAALEEGALVLSVQDSGTFVPRVAPRGDLPERGRGLAFMGEMMDEVHLRPSPEGTLVRLAKRLPEPG